MKAASTQTFFFNSNLLVSYCEKTMKKKIIITGFMNSGKSYLCKKLSQILKTKCCDLDKSIENMKSMSIREVFDQKGEKYFRKLEKKVFYQFFLKKDVKIISLGGGTLEELTNINYIKEHSIIVWTFSRKQDLIHLNKKKDETRPLLKEHSDFKKLSNLYNKRVKKYRKADIKLNIKNENKVKELIRHVRTIL